MKQQVESQLELTHAQIGINKQIQTEFRVKMESLEEWLQRSQEQSARMELMMSSMMGMLEGLAGALQSGQCHHQASVAPSLPVISQESTPSAERYWSTSLASDVSTPTRQRWNHHGDVHCSTRQVSQPCRGPYNSY